MKRLMVGLGAMALATGLALAAPAERWLHVRVQDGGGGKDGETVHVNIPLSLAEKVLPAVQADRLKDGKIKIEDCDMKGVDVRAVLQAIRDTRDGEFVTVEGSDNHVRVAK